jgi:hypothetical protein
MPKSTYEERIKDADSKEDLLELIKIIKTNKNPNNTEQRVKVLMKLIDIRMGELDKEDKEEAVVEPPPAKRTKYDELISLHEKKHQANMEYLKAKIEADIKHEEFNETLLKLDKYIVSDDDVDEDFLSNLFDELDRVKNINVIEHYKNLFAVYHEYRVCLSKEKCLKKKYDDIIVEDINQNINQNIEKV